MTQPDTNGSRRKKRPFPRFHTRIVQLKGHHDPTIASLRGFAGRLGKKLSWSEMRDIARADHWKAKTKKHQGFERIQGIKRLEP